MAHNHPKINHFHCPVPARLVSLTGIDRRICCFLCMKQNISQCMKDFIFFSQHPTLLYNTFMDYGRFATSISPPPAGHYRKHISIYINQFSNKNHIMNERSCNMWKKKVFSWKMKKINLKLTKYICWTAVAYHLTAEYISNDHKK